jgi:hypothetical protein
MSSLLVCLVLLCGDLPAPDGDVFRTEKPPVTTLEEAAQAEARAIRALDKGDRAKAVAERRNVVRFWEDNLKPLPWVVNGDILDTEVELAVARARLAEAEGNLLVLLVELGRVVRHCERTIPKYQLMVVARAISPAEAAEAERKARDQILEADARLAKVEKQLRGWD